VTLAKRKSLISRPFAAKLASLISGTEQEWTLTIGQRWITARCGDVELGGVQILGHSHMARRAAWPASQMLSSNLTNFVQHFWDKASASFRLDLEDEILKGCLVTHAGEIRNERVRELAAAGKGNG
jgi:hypothetical protein